MSLEDTSLMPFGKFQGKPLQDVPVSYFHWLYHIGLKHKELKEYIEKSWDALKMENKDLVWVKQK